MNERVEEIRRGMELGYCMEDSQWYFRACRDLLRQIEQLKSNFVDRLSEGIAERDALLTALAQAERERDLYFQGLGDWKVMCERARAEVERLKARLQEEMDWHAAAVEGQQRAEARTRTLVAAAGYLLSTYIAQCRTMGYSSEIINAFDAVVKMRAALTEPTPPSRPFTEKGRAAFGNEYPRVGPPPRVNPEPTPPKEEQG